MNIEKIDLDKVKKRPEYTIEKLQNDIIKLLVERDSCLDYKSFLMQTLLKYRDLLKEKDCIDGIFYREVKKEIQSVTDRIKSILSYYLKGSISSSYATLGRWWNGKGEQGFRPYASAYKMKENQTFYRMRNKEGNIKFDRKGMFHVPYSLRHILKNCRYSITGFPCLYIGKSIYGCWEEMGKPTFNDFYVSALKPNTQITLLDLRLTRNDFLNEESKRSYLISLPIIIACSVENHNENNSFIPEYIIPQMMLHAILLERKNNKGFDGIVYTSTKCISAPKIFEDEDLHSNIVIPVKGYAKDQKYCSYLTSMFKITNPISADYEFLKINKGAKGNGKWTKYKKSIFGSLEDDLNFEKLAEICNE